MIEPLSQRDPRWANTYLGTSKTTINDYGCTLTSLTMLLNYYGSNYTPDQVNEKLKSVNGFSNGNLIIWSAISKAFPNVKSVERVWNYDNDKVASNLPALVEVDGSRIGATKHWVLYIGNQKMNDPWFGNEKATSYYKPTGCAIFKVDKIDSTINYPTNPELEKCEVDRDRYREERNKASKELEAEIEAHKHTKSQHQAFVDRLADLYGSAHSEESVIKFAMENSNVIDERDEYKVKYEKEVQARKVDYAKHQEELKQLRAENEVLAKQIQTLKDRIDNAIDESNEAKEKIKDDDIKPSKTLWDYIKSLLSIFKG